MKKEPIPFHPPLIALLPVLSLLASNINMVPPAQAVRPIFVTVVGSLLVWAVFAAGVRDVRKGAMAATTLILVTLIFGFTLRQINESFSAHWIVGLWLVAGVGFGLLAAFRCPWNRVLNVIAGMTFLVSVVQTGVGYGRAASAQFDSAIKGAGAGIASTKPDIYYLILDGHGSDKTLERVFGLPAEEGLGHRLEKQGFFVAHESHANYIQTELSLGSSMNLDYLQTLLPDIDPEEKDRYVLKALTNNSRLGEYLKSAGYEMIVLRSDIYPPLSFSQADTVISHDRGMTFIEATLLELIPLGRSESVLRGLQEVHRNEIKGMFANLDKLAGKAAKPRFILVHMICPHPPFVFGPNGENRVQEGPFGLWDGPDWRHYVGGHEDYLNGYRDQVQYIDKMVEKTTRRLIEASREPPIIVVQGDHGSKSGLDAESSSATDLSEVFSILNAYYVPDSVRQKLEPDTSPINTWRIILREVFGEDLPDLPVESYWSAYTKPMKFDRVTEKIRSAD